MDCKTCNGTGKINQSDCCGAEIYDDVGICSECKEHCEEDECGDCEGTGDANYNFGKEEALAEWKEKKNQILNEDKTVNREYQIDNLLESADAYRDRLKDGTN